MSKPLSSKQVVNFKYSRIFFNLIFPSLCQYDILVMNYNDNKGHKITVCIWEKRNQKKLNFGQESTIFPTLKVYEKQ